MLKSAIAACLFVGSANAQEIKSLYTVQDCGPPKEMFEFSTEIGETPLFIGTTTVQGIEGLFYTGEMMFTVNQDTGTWTMFSMYGDGTICVTAFGDFFEPS